MRLSRVTPSNIDELKQQVLDDLECLEPGLHLVARDLPVEGRGSIDVLAADGRGRLAACSIAIEADCALLGRSLRCWEWLSSSRPSLRSLIRMDGLDLGLPPRLIIAASRFDEEVEAIAGRLVRPDVEMIAVDCVAEGNRKGILARRIEGPSPVAGGSDTVLESVPPGKARSLMRRVLEELTHTAQGGDVRPGRSRGCVDVHRGSRVVASLLAAEDGLEVRRHDRIDSFHVTGDEDCRRAAAFLARPEPRPAASPLVGASLSAEEIAEFQSLQKRGERVDSGKPEGASVGAPSGAGAPPRGPVEN